MNHLDVILAMGHADIYAAVQRGPGAGAAMAAEDMWRRAREIVVEAERDTTAAITASTDGWQGAGADAARSGLRALNTWVLEAINDAHNTASSLTEQGMNALALRNSVPTPHEYEVTAALSAATANPDDAAALNRLDRAQTMAQDPRVIAQGDVAKERLREYVGQSYDNLRAMSFWTVPPTITVDASPVPRGDPGAGGGRGVSDLAPVGAAGAATPVPGGSGTGGSGTGGAGTGGSAGGAAAVAGPGGVGPAGGTYGGTPHGVPPVAVTPGGALPAGRGPGAGPQATGVGPSAVPPGGRPPIGSGPVLPPGSGGRGVRPLPDPTGTRPVTPRAPGAVAPAPSWRDLVARQPGASGGPAGTGAGGAGPGRTIGGFPGARPDGGGALAAPRPEPRGAFPAAETGRSTGSTGHGLYPPMGGTGGGQQGQDHRRAPYLVDDSGAFDVSHLPCTDPVIGEPEPRA